MKMKVLHLLKSNSYSGAENVAISIIQHMPASVECFYVSPKGPIDKLMKEKKINRLALDKFSIGEVHKAVKKIEPDLIHAHDFSSSIYSVAAGTGIPVISHLHNNNPWSRYINLKAVGYFVTIPFYKKILTVSDSIMDEYVFGKIGNKKNEVIGNPVDVKLIRGNISIDSIEKKYDIVFLGRLTDQKNPIRFMQVVSMVHQRIPDLKVLVIGDGELKRDVYKEADKLGIMGNICFTGFLSNPYEKLCECKVMCMPSLWEGYGLAAVEALTFGLPVVSSDAGGLKSIINDSCGKICYTDDEFVLEICCLLKDETYYEKKKNGALSRILQLDNADQYFNKIFQVYCNAVNEYKC
ncbi:MAG: glycosyltransferase [Clostridium sp.]|nr:glycosyltransferase [Clostridium sp.]